MMNEDLMFCHLGNGITVVDRNRQKNNDYLEVAHINYSRLVTYYGHKLSHDAIHEIEIFAKAKNKNISATQEGKVLRPLTDDEIECAIYDVFVHEIDSDLRIFDIYNDDCIDAEIIQRCLDHCNDKSLVGFEHEYIDEPMNEGRFNYIHELKNEIIAEPDYTELHVHIGKWLKIDKNMDRLHGVVSFLDSSDPIREMIGRTKITARIVRLSNFIGLDSHYGMRYEYFYDEYLKEVIDILCLNPHLVKEIFSDYGFKTVGDWPDLKERDALVNYEEFAQEIQNRTSHSQLVFLGMLPVSCLYDKKFAQPKSVKIPKGKYCGFFGNISGGGSLLEMQLKKDLVVNLRNTQSITDRYEMIVDAKNCRVGYCINETYDKHISAWGKEFELTY